ncbi:MAG: ribbon-helix-helix protein, CopG family [Candidatus Solibacter usitatus]|nr:ribbon-helix-helix protein, CopG family [Candidatus Solibacter usitatus]
MIRTQIQLTDDQLTALRRLSSIHGKSTAELIRNAIDQYLAGKHLTKTQDRIERAIRVAGRFASGLTDVSAGHNRHLAEAFRR